jgi:pantetheine-phosphate adenylyltransferase
MEEDFIIDIVPVRKQKIAIYPGSFDPFTIGHLNILEKVEAIFGKENSFICIGINPKKIPVETQKIIADYTESEIADVMNRMKQTKINRTKLHLPSKNVDGYVGLLTDYVFEKEKEGFDVVVVRGLRNGYDLDYEYNQTRFMWDKKPDLKIIYIPCDPIYGHVSSTAYRDLEITKPGSGYEYLARE